MYISTYVLLYVCKQSQVFNKWVHPFIVFQRKFVLTANYYNKMLSLFPFMYRFIKVCLLFIYQSPISSMFTPGKLFKIKPQIFSLESISNLFPSITQTDFNFQQILTHFEYHSKTFALIKSKKAFIIQLASPMTRMLANCLDLPKLNKYLVMKKESIN